MMRKSFYLALVLVLAWAPGAVAAQKDSGRFRLAVVGLDYDHAWGMLRDIVALPQAQLVAIADTHPELIAKAKTRVPPGVKFYSNYVTMLDEVKPQGVIITTAYALHYPITRLCARRHINVEMEKPMATTAAEAREMERLGDEAHITLMVNYFNNWLPSYRLLHQQVEAGKIGQVFKLVAQFGNPGPKEIHCSKESIAWLYDPAKGGGALLDFGCYVADLALWLKGRPTRVFARTLKLRTNQHNAVEDDAEIVLEYPDATVVLEPSWDYPFTMERIEAIGFRGSLLALPNALLYRGYGERASAEYPDGKPVALSSIPMKWKNPIAYFIDRVEHNQPVEGLLSARMNVEVNEILDAARESFRTGCPVAMPAK